MSATEEEFWWHLRAHKLERSCVREFRFCRERRFRFDFAWPASMLAVEIDGLGRKGRRGAEGGGHQTIRGYTSDREKDTLAILQGWRVLRFTPDQVKSGFAIWAILQLKQREVNMHERKNRALPELPGDKDRGETLPMPAGAAP